MNVGGRACGTGWADGARRGVAGRISRVSKESRHFQLFRFARPMRLGHSAEADESHTVQRFHATQRNRNLEGLPFIIQIVCAQQTPPSLNAIPLSWRLINFMSRRGISFRGGKWCVQRLCHCYASALSRINSHRRESRLGGAAVAIVPDARLCRIVFEPSTTVVISAEGEFDVRRPSERAATATVQ